jgi:peptide/nickel transport system substrate-binding protein
MPPALGDFAVDLADLPNSERDLDRARELLSEAGYDDDVEVTIRTITGRTAYGFSAEVIQSNLAEAGITAQIEPVDIGIWIDDWVNRRFPPTMNNAGGGTEPDLFYFRHFHSRPEGADFRNWNNEEGDALLQAGRATFDEAERIEIYHEFQRLVAEDVPSIPLYSPNLLIVQQEHVQGYVPHPTGYFTGFKHAWVDDSR